MYSKMRPMRFIDNYRDTMAVRNLRDLCNIRDHPVISGGGQKYGADILKMIQRIRNLHGIDRSINAAHEAGKRILFQVVSRIMIRAAFSVAFPRIQIRCPDPAQRGCVKRGPVGVSRHQKTVVGF